MLLISAFTDALVARSAFGDTEGSETYTTLVSGAASLPALSDKE